MSSHQQAESPPASSVAHEGSQQAAPLPPQKSTPIVKKQGGHVPFASQVEADVDKTRPLLDSEMTGRWVGPMPVDEFFDRYLPSASEQLPPVPEHSFADMFAHKEEKNRYSPFILATADWMPGFVGVDTSDRATQQDYLKPDVSVYRAGDNGPSKADFSQMELWIEFKASLKGSPFLDPKKQSPGSSNKQPSFVPATVSGENARGQLTDYAVSLHARQFRHFSFSLFIAGEYARFLRWDHAGTIVSAAFNFREQPEIMASFFWRFSHLSEEQRGHDMSVRPANLSEALDAHVREKLPIKDIADKSIPLFQYDLPGLSGKGHAYGPFPPQRTRSLVSRCTRSLPVLYIPDGSPERNDDGGESGCGSPCSSENPPKVDPWMIERVVYLKDTWRFLPKDPEKIVMTEHEIYERLHAHNTPHIPELVAGGDVPGGMTRTQEVLDAEWLTVGVRVTAFQHYRLVLDVIGRALTTFESTKELVQAVYDAMQAHWHAYEKARILHRDISVGNIIITNDGRGLLIDWEMGKLLDDIGPRRYDRTGTWQFMSAALLRNFGKEHLLSDDLESFLHVLGWIVLRFIPATESYPCQERASDLKMFDEANFHVEGHTFGGKDKASALRGGAYPSDTFKFKRSTPLSKLLTTLCEPFKALYAMHTPTDEDRAELISPQNKSGEELEDLRVFVRHHDRNMETLKSSTWFIKTIKAALDQKGWPEDDKADPMVYKPSTGLYTEKQVQIRKNRLDTEHSQFESARSSGTQGSKRSPPSPTPEPSAKRRRGASRSVPLTSNSYNSYTSS